MTERITKTQQVLKHLQEKGSITSWQAIQMYRATRLSAIIFNLNKKYVISTRRCEGYDQLGNHSWWAEYIYEGERAVPLVDKVEEAM